MRYDRLEFQHWKRWSLVNLHHRLAALEAEIEDCVARSDNADYRRRWEFIIEPSEVERIYCAPDWLRVEYRALAEYCWEREKAEIAALKAEAALPSLSELIATWSRLEGWV